MNVLAELGLTAPEVTPPLPVADCAVDSVAACLAAAGELALARTGRRPDVILDTAHVAAAVRSELLLRDPAGDRVDGFAPLSRLWPAADGGWVRTHANYPWHRTALLAALGVSDDRDVAAAIAARPAAEVEDLVYAAGGLAVAARTREQWPAADLGPLVAVRPAGAGRPLPPPGPLPASNLRVLDLTRVIAGPVGTRMLGALGADVLRVDDPNRPELPLHAIDGVIGKRSTLLDASTEQGRTALHRLAAEADVVVTGYRPGALRRLGLEPDQLPGTIVATLSAWGDTPGWERRRGFDSLVQIATGIGWACGDGVRPGALPFQLLDHATGYLLAAGVLTALALRARGGGISHVSVSLARTAQWQLAQGMGTRDEGLDAAPYRVELGNGWSSISPPGRLDGRALAWPCLPPEYGTAAPRFIARG